MRVPAAMRAASWRPVLHPGRAAYGGLLFAIGSGRALPAPRARAAGAVLRPGGDRRRPHVRAGADRVLPGGLRLRPAHRARLGRSVSAREPGGARSCAAGVRPARRAEPAGSSDRALRGGGRPARLPRSPPSRWRAAGATGAPSRRFSRPTPSAGSRSSFSAAIRTAARRWASRRRSGSRAILSVSLRSGHDGECAPPPRSARRHGWAPRQPPARRRKSTRSGRARRRGRPWRSARRSARRGARRRGRG